VPLARTHSVALVGVTGHVVEVEADIANGLVGTILVGLPDAALREARDRIRAAIVNSGEEWPQRKITVALSPASLPKRGSWFDLAPPVGVFQRKHREKAEMGRVTTPVRLGRAAGRRERTWRESAGGGLLDRPLLLDGAGFGFIPDPWQGPTLNCCAALPS
jgi:Subunit ChlI of Mg-chelatase